MEGFYHYNIRKNKDAKGRISLGQVLSSDIIFILGGIQMHHGWSPHDGMRAPSCGALMIAWGLHHDEP